MIEEREAGMPYIGSVPQECTQLGHVLQIQFEAWRYGGKGYCQEAFDSGRGYLAERTFGRCEAGQGSVKELSAKEFTTSGERRNATL